MHIIHYDDHRDYSRFPSTVIIYYRSIEYSVLADKHSLSSNMESLHRVQNVQYLCTLNIDWEGGGGGYDELQDHYIEIATAMTKTMTKNHRLQVMSKIFGVGIKILQYIGMQLEFLACSAQGHKEISHDP